MAQRRTIIAGFDGTELARDGLVLAGALASAMDAHLMIADVYPFNPRTVLGGADEYERTLRKQAEKVLAGAPGLVGDRVDVETRAIAGLPPRELHQLAEHENADMIVLGSAREAPEGQTLAGSVGEGLLHGAPCTVTVAPRGLADRKRVRLDTVAVAFDGLPDGRAALVAAAALARDAGGRLRVLAAAEALPDGGGSAAERQFVEREREHLQRQLDGARDLVPDEVECGFDLLSGRPSEALAAAAAEGDIDLLVLGSRGYGPGGRVLLGGTTGRLIRAAPCALTVVPRVVETD